MKSKYAFIVIGVVIGLALVFAAWGLAQRNYRFQGSLIDPPIQAADFSLTDTNGNPFRLSDQKGKIVLVFFGYTHCPDVCPVTLSQYKQIKQQLKNQAEDIRFVFITVDPQRDTIEAMRRYVPNFDPQFIGLTGSPEQIEQVKQSYGVYSENNPADEQGNYLVDHTARIYLIDQQGNWRLTYPFGMETGQIVSDLQHLLQ
jgi:protein SCO1/2